jgi:hypothetical protein
MKRSEVYLKAAEYAFSTCRNSQFFANVFSACAAVNNGIEHEKYYPELNADEVLDDNEEPVYKKVTWYSSTDYDRDFILLFASELAKDSGN